jgi:hypothetical protein
VSVGGRAAPTVRAACVPVRLRKVSAPLGDAGRGAAQLPARTGDGGGRFADLTPAPDGNRQQAERGRVFLLKLVTPPSPTAARYQLSRRHVAAPLAIGAVPPHRDWPGFAEPEGGDLGDQAEPNPDGGTLSGFDGDPCDSSQGGPARGDGIRPPTARWPRRRTAPASRDRQRADSPPKPRRPKPHTGPLPTGATVPRMCTCFAYALNAPNTVLRSPSVAATDL